MQKQLKKEYVQPTSKGQITIPSVIRKTLGITPDTLLEVVAQKHGVFLKPVQIGTPSEHWETVVDFTEFSPNGIALDDLVGRLQQWTKSKKRSGN